jgi:hypothetical protein
MSWTRTVFPSRVPAGRVEVKCLEAWMDAMLNKVREEAKAGSGVVIAGKSVEEEDVLFVCLHEIARQVAVMCDERGELLFRIRR